MEDIIKRCYDFLVKHISEADVPQESKNYRIEHSMRVANIGKFLAEREKADIKITVIGCLLHDVGKFDTEDNMEHGRISANVARGFLSDTALSQKEVEDICYAIAVHVDGTSGYDYEETLESKIVSDSDNLDRFGAFRIYQTMEWQKEYREGTIENRIIAVQKLIDRRNRLKREFALGTITANEIWVDYLDYQIEYFERYLEELRITTVDIL